MKVWIVNHITDEFYGSQYVEKVFSEQSLAEIFVSQQAYPEQFEIEEEEVCTQLSQQS